MKIKQTEGFKENMKALEGFCFLCTVKQVQPTCTTSIILVHSFNSLIASRRIYTELESGHVRLAQKLKTWLPKSNLKRIYVSKRTQTNKDRCLSILQAHGFLQNISVSLKMAYKYTVVLRNSFKNFRKKQEKKVCWGLFSVVCYYTCSSIESIRSSKTMYETESKDLG